MKHAGTQTIQTDRLILRKYEIADAEDMFRNWVTDPENSRFWSWEPHKDISETKSLISGWIDEYTKADTYHWVIVLKSTSQAIGYIYFDEIDNAAQSLSVHYLISRKLWNQGIATEACKSVLEFAFNTIGASKVHSRHHIENPASGKVLRKCGMGYVYTEYKHYPDCERISGNYRIYEITRHTYKS